MSKSFLGINNFSGRDSDVLYILMLLSGKYNFLPELYDVLGYEMTLKVLDIFAGTEIKFPSEKEFARLARDVSVYSRLSSVTPSMKESVVNQISLEYNISVSSVNDIYESVSSSLKSLGLKALENVRRKSTGSPNKIT